MRPGVNAQITDEQVRVFFDHLLSLSVSPVENLDVFLCSNGGSSTVPWRLVALFREFAKKFNVLVPFRSYSAATLISLGADEIVLHPFAELGPIDPTVSNNFNPVDKNGNQLGISVEDVRAYVSFIKDTVGITHEDELIEAIKILAEKVHPLALGNVERFVMQSRMTAKKILKTHMREEADDHKINEIMETMVSKLYFHGHPINRCEAGTDLRLKVAKPAPTLENLMWQLYCDFEKDFKNNEAYLPGVTLAKMGIDAIQTAPPIPIPPLPPAPQPTVPPIPAINHKEDLLLVAIEDTKVSSTLQSTQHFQQTVDRNGTVLTNYQKLIAYGWKHEKA
ncbi:MAG TPA: hypothetical protein VK737_07005 [Opitutales bacterium]|nr:hypothetical protein [Opitutales bacterium]